MNTRALAGLHSGLRRPHTATRTREDQVSLHMLPSTTHRSDADPGGEVDRGDLALDVGGRAEPT